MKFTKKIESSALQYAIVVVMVVALLLGGLVLHAGMSSKLQTRFDMQDRLLANAKSGLEYGKAQIDELEYDNPTVIQLYEEVFDKVIVTKQSWGAFDLLKAEVSHENISFQLQEMMGNYLTEKPISLYLADRGSALSLCGKTEIKGKVKIPARGVKRAYIAGQNFEGKQLINGTIGNSENTLPEINEAFLAQLDKSIISEKLVWEAQDSIVRSFSDSVLYFFASDAIAINNTFLKGRIIIESSDSVFVARSAFLENVIIKAPIIYIEAGFEGNAQFIAEHTIVLEDNVTLKYPSVVALIEKQSFQKASAIIVGQKSVVIGSVLVHSTNNNYKKEALLDVAENAQIHGMAYSNGSVQLNGEIHGSLITKKFFLKTASSAYENHLLNATITDALPTAFCIVPLLKNQYETITLSCLN